ncbi:hypothetical protein HPB48_006777 [Haemaphysalis longicornis]|uniref:Uncharacterized protein n=1 Tax=Haemaphysalis longicornis TaxID=44386 RepID=A0A9J6FNT4_HAELO|nr:hypothetical protein HPB48_006777 [Haemaphysalis longicornis]
MTLRKWTTNSDKRRDFLQQEQRAASREMVALQISTVEVLGIIRDPAKDPFSFVMNNQMDFLEIPNKHKTTCPVNGFTRVFDPGGWWECPGRSVKTTLRRILRSSAPHL